MEINVSGEFFKRAKEYIETKEPYATVEAFIENAVDAHMECYPWGLGDICVHNEECMHWKTVEDWKKEVRGGER